MYKLLIVDDNYIQIQSLIHYIQWKNYNITEIKTAQNGKDGLALFKTFQPDIIITDVVMPVMDGPEMTKEIQKISNKPIFIYISCYEDFEYLQNAMSNEVISYILKPIDQQVLEESVKKVINKIKEKEKYNSLDKVFEEGLDILRENFLYRLIYSKHINMEYLKNAAHDLKFDNYKTFIAAKFEIMQEKDKYIDIYNLVNFTKTNLLKNINGIIAVENETRLAALIMSEESDKNLFYRVLYDMLEKSIKLIKEECNIEFNTGLSKVCESIYDTHLMLNQASCALENNLSINEFGINIYQDDENIKTDYNTIDLKESLNSIVNNPTSQEINHFIDTYCPDDIHASRNSIKALYVNTVAAIQLFLIGYNLDIKDVFGRADVLWHKTNRFDNTKEFRLWLRNIINAISEFINNNEKDKHEKLVSKIVDYINRNYRYISNVEQIASNLYISSSYARSIFKKYIGKTIFDYLIAVRMDEAQRLLSNQNSKVYEVAEIVGYKSKPHFVSTFKQYTGMMPSEFQQYMAGKDKRHAK